MRRHLFFLLMLGFSAAIENGQGASNPLSRSRQCVVVLTDNWNSTKGELRAFERNAPSGSWRGHGASAPVVVGKNGQGWGRGVVSLGARNEPTKIEGDNKVPAGIFRFGSAFGYASASSARWMKLPYLALSRETEGIDDPRSRYYNRLVDRSKVARVDWRTSEQMRRTDDLYKWGVVVEHNPRARPGAGSCIFLHTWKNSATPTTGCTAMAEKDLLALLRWLDPIQRPVLVQMPRAHYEKFRSAFGLPLVPAG